LKKVIAIIGSIVILILVAHFSINLFINSKLNYVKEKVIENYPEITNVENINSIGKWGEWFSEYALVIEMWGMKYRIWTNNEGKITDKVPL